MIVLLTILVHVNSISCILLAWELLTNNKRGEDNPANFKSKIKSSRDATVTNLIVSAFFLFFNTIQGWPLQIEQFEHVCFAGIVMRLNAFQKQTPYPPFLLQTKQIKEGSNGAG